MSVKHRALRATNKLTTAWPGRKLPTYFSGELLWLDRQCWNSVYSRYEPHMAQAIRRYLPRGGVFWDVGANIGQLSLFASKIVGPEGFVIAFEPSPDVLAVLHRNTDDYSNITVRHFGIGAFDGEAQFSAQGLSSASSFVADVTAINRSFLPKEPITQVPAQMRRLDTILESHPAPTLIKIDIEGFELEALKGADRVLGLAKPSLLIEIHPRQMALSGGSEAALFEKLGQHGYSWTVIDRNPNSLYSILAARVR